MPKVSYDKSRLQRLQQKGERVRTEVSGLTTEIQEAVSGLQTIAREQMGDRPYAVLTAATGVGYVLGGGLPTTLARMLLGFGGRLGLVMLAQRIATGRPPIATKDPKLETERKETNQ